MPSPVPLRPAARTLHPGRWPHAVLPGGAPPRGGVLPGRELRPLRPGPGPEAPAWICRFDACNSYYKSTGALSFALPRLRVPAPAAPPEDSPAPAPRPERPDHGGHVGLQDMRAPATEGPPHLLPEGLLRGIRAATTAVVAPIRAALTLKVMPHRPPHSCTVPGCPALVRKGGRCPDHARALQVEIDSRRPSPSRRGYGGAWRAIRLEHLRRHPLCEMDCAARGQTVAASEVDHRVPLARGGTHDTSNLQSACTPCHSRKTVREDGRFGPRRHGRAK